MTAGRPPRAAASPRGTRAVIIEPIGAAHLALLTALHGRCFSPSWTEATMASLLAVPGAYGVLATQLDNGAALPVGFALARVVADEAELLAIGVVPERQRQGVARRLVAACVARAAAAGAVALFLEVGEANQPARALYDGLGFQVVGRRARYYETAAGFEDALVMRRDLVA